MVVKRSNDNIMLIQELEISLLPIKPMKATLIFEVFNDICRLSAMASSGPYCMSCLGYITYTHCIPDLARITYCNTKIWK